MPEPKQLLPPLTFSEADKARYVEEYHILKSMHPGARLRLNGEELFFLLTAIQLACHNPAFHGLTKERMVSLAQTLRPLVTAPGSVLDRAIQMGWDHIPESLRP